MRGCRRLDRGTRVLAATFRGLRESEVPGAACNAAAPLSVLSRGSCVWWSVSARTDPAAVWIRYPDARFLAVELPDELCR